MLCDMSRFPARRRARDAGRDPRSRLEKVRDLGVPFRRARPAPWREGNAFRLMDDGEEFFARMLAAIDAARTTVMLEMYLVTSGRLATRFVTALAAAAARGVRVAVLFDGFGSLGLRAEDRRRLTDAGAELCFYNVLGWRKRLANFLRDHRKLLLVDERVAFVGGAGLADEFLSDRPGGAWRDLMTEIRGPVLGDWHRLYCETWRRSGGTPIAPLAAPPQRLPDGVPGRVTTSAGWQRSELAEQRRRAHQRGARTRMGDQRLLRAVTALSQSVAPGRAARR